MSEGKQTTQPNRKEVEGWIGRWKREGEIGGRYASKGAWLTKQSLNWIFLK